jgi:NADH-quinone oxidoreductase subunit L
LINIPLIILAALSLVAGFIELPDSIGNIHWVSNLLNSVLPKVLHPPEVGSEILFQLMAAVLSISGIYIAYLLYYKKSALTETFSKSLLNKFFYHGWEFDRIYDILFVRPVVWLSEIDKNDFIDLFNKGIARIVLIVNDFLSTTQNGKLRWYIMALAFGIVFILTVLMNV